LEPKCPKALTKGSPSSVAQTRPPRPYPTHWGHIAFRYQILQVRGGAEGGGGGGASGAAGPSLASQVSGEPGGGGVGIRPSTATPGLRLVRSRGLEAASHWAVSLPAADGGCGDVRLRLPRPRSSP